MRRRASLIVCAVGVLAATTALAQLLPSATPEEVGFSAERLDRIGRILRGEIEKRRLPGAVALVARKGRVAYFESRSEERRVGKECRARWAAQPQQKKWNSTDGGRQ